MEPNQPPRKHYGLKSREFDRLNNAASAPEKSVAHDVTAMLQQNRSEEESRTSRRFEIRKTSSRRKRDYWLMIVLSTGFFSGVAWLGRSNPMVFICALSGLIVANIGLTWIVWFVMDRD